MKIRFLFVILICSTNFLSCSNKRQRANSENIKKIKIGMGAGQVRKIMGEQDIEYQLPGNGKTFNYSYSATFGTSDNYYITFSRTDSSVVAVGYGH